MIIKEYTRPAVNVISIQPCAALAGSETPKGSVCNESYEEETFTW